MSNSVLTATRFASMQVLKLKKNSPAIFFVAGIVGVTASVVLASRATLHVEDVIEDTQERIVEAQTALTLESDEYDENDYRKDVTIIYAHAAGEFTKLYGPAVVCGVIGIACLTGQYRILSKRNAALTAAYAALDRSYRAYRERVRWEIGEEKERELHYTATLEQKERDKKALETTDSKKKKRNPNLGSDYARFFDETNQNWQKVREYNILFLRAQQEYANKRLQMLGYLLLNDVYESLGLKRSTAGSVVGWTLDGNGDGYVDFGIFDRTNEDARAFVNLLEPAILLDFNVDGVIYKEIDKFE